MSPNTCYLSLRSAQILGWTGPLTGEHDRVACFRIGRPDRFDLNLVFPAIAKVVEVAEFSPGPRHHLGQRRLPFILVVLFDEHIRITVRHLANAEIVQMGVLPPHGELDDVVQIAQSEIARHGDAAPDRRRQTEERHLELMNGRG
jgi:hypothetical protein